MSDLFVLLCYLNVLTLSAQALGKFKLYFESVNVSICLISEYIYVLTVGIISNVVTLLCY